MLTHDETYASMFLFRHMEVNSFVLETFCEDTHPSLWINFGSDYMLTCSHCSHEFKAFFFGRIFKSLCKSERCFFVKNQSGLKLRIFDWYTLEGASIATLSFSGNFFENADQADKLIRAIQHYELELVSSISGERMYARYGDESFQVVLNGNQGMEKNMEKYEMTVTLGSIEVTLDEMMEIRKGKKIYLSPEASHEVIIKLGSLSIATGKTTSIQEIEIQDLKPSFMKQLL